MASAKNKVTGQFISRGIKYDADMGPDWIINPTPAQIAQIDDDINSAPEKVKDKAIKKKDEESAEVLTNGYEVAPGKIMSTSAHAQIKWSLLMLRIARGFAPDYPYPLSLINGDVYYAQDATELEQIFDAAFAEKNDEYVVKLNERKAIFDS